MQMNLIVRTCSCVTAVLLVVSTSLHQVNAAGFALIEHSASSMGNAFAGAAAIAEDASTIYFNPAGMSLLGDEHVVATLHFISPNATFTNSGSKEATAVDGNNLTGGDGDGGADALVPNFYYVKPLTEDIRFGVGINVPFGLAVKYDDDWVGRYHGVDSELKTVNINPSVSYKLSPSMAIGYGINMQTARIILTSAIDFGAICYGLLGQDACTSLNVEAQKNDGFALLQGSDSLSFGWNVGMIFQASPQTRWGASYRSPVSHYIKGTADFTVPGNVAFITASPDANDPSVPGAFTDTGLKAKLRTPDVFSFSLVHQLNATTTIMSDYTWTGWSNFEELRVDYDNPLQPDSVTTEGWSDSRRYAVGINVVTSNKLIMRAGLAYDQTPIPSAARRTPRLPGAGRTWFSLGAHYQYSKLIALDFAYSHLSIDDAKINNQVESESDLAPFIAANLSGVYEGSVDIFSAQLVWGL